MIKLSHPSKVLKGIINLPSSKSISNRMLILQHLYEPDLKLDNLSSANDTVLLKSLLEGQDQELNVQDAGTAFRFILAYCAAIGGSYVIRGSERLHERPIEELANVLEVLGAKITYLNKEGFAPLKIESDGLSGEGVLDLSEVKSSQFVSAILMIMPKINGDVQLKINHKMNSFSYVVLTVSALRRMGFSVESKGTYVKVSKHQKFKGEYFKVEPDWTSFYYWYAMAHLSSGADLLFPGINQTNMHKDRKRLFDIGNVQLRFEDKKEGFHIQKDKANTHVECPSLLNFSQFPDLAPTFALLLPALGCGCELTGLESLKFKECDREFAIGQYLKQMNSSMTKSGNVWCIEGSLDLASDTQFDVFDDHRMAMSLAPLALIQPIQLANENVVKKSYPNFWNDLVAAGFEIEYL